MHTTTEKSETTSGTAKQLAGIREWHARVVPMIGQPREPDDNGGLDATDTEALIDDVGLLLRLLDEATNAAGMALACLRVSNPDATTTIAALETAIAATEGK